jgi:uncharacterized SAM-binding protein YcdF (DUF218 family)
MIYWHKILPMLVLPVGIVLVLLLVAAFTKKRGVSLLAAFVLLFFSLPLTSSFLIRAAEDFAVRLRIGEIQPADAIVVLSGMLMSAPSAGGTVTEWMDPDRFFAGVELFKAEKAAVLVFTGGKMPWLPDSPPEGQIFKQLAVQLGVPVDRIIVTTDVQNTEEEAREVRARVGDGKTVILVTSAYHMPRARQLFVASGVNVIPFPVDFKVEAGGTFTILDVLPSAVSLWKSETAIRELFGRAFYTVKLALSPPH